MSHATAETIAVGPFSVRFLLEGDDSGGSVSVFECHVPANCAMQAPHSHDGFEETIYGLEGATTWTIDGETTEVGVGEAVCVRRGAVHGFENRGARMRSSWRSPAPASSAPPTSARWARCSPPPPAARRTSPPWAR